MERQAQPGEIQIFLLGPFEAKQGGQAIKGFESDKARSLMAYLALERDYAHTREALTELLWPDLPPAAARHNLSQVMFSLKEIFGEPGAEARLFLADRSSIEVNPEAEVWVDAREFETMIEASSRHQHQQAASCAHCMRLRRRAVELYRDDFLRGLTIDASATFDDWVILKRERMHRLAIEALFELTRYHEWRGEFEQAQVYARRQVELEPWREEAHQQLMRILSHSGQRSAALAQFELLRKILDEELGVPPTWESEALYKRIRNADRVQAHNLPPQSTPFMGRREEVAEILLTLAHPDCRVLTILGQGGAGKTRVALQVAERARERFLNGVWFLPLVGLTSSDLLLPALVNALDFHLSKQGDLKAQLLGYLSQKEMLLVMDNFEHLQDGTRLVAEIAANAPGVKILITSRARMNLTQAWVMELGGFDVPAGNGKEDFWSNAAVRLFLHSARRVRSDFDLSQDDQEAVRRICAAVDGLPLAIELAAAWTRVLTCTEIHQEIEKSLEFLATPAVDVAPRHQSMRAVMDHSWRLLSPQEQEVLRGLGILRGSFTYEAARQVAGATLPLLAALLDKSILRKTVHGRYELHELVRQYAFEALATSVGVYEETGRRHATYFSDLVENKEVSLRDGSSLEARGEIGQEMENIRAAWNWAVTREEGRLVERMANGLFWLCEWGNRFVEGLELFRQAVDQLTRKMPAGEAWPAGLMTRCGRFHARLAEYENARALFQESDKVLRDRDDQKQLAMLLDFWGDLEREMGDFQKAKNRLEESVHLLRQAGDPPGLALALNHFGAAVHRLGRYEQARALYEESLGLFRQAGNQFGVAMAVYNLGFVSYDLGDFAAARAYYEESLARRDELADRWGVAEVYNNLGIVYYDMSDYNRAAKFFEKSLEMRQELGDRRGMSITLNNLGMISTAHGEYRQAEGQYGGSLALSREIGNQQGVSIALNNLGDVAWLQGTYQQAYQYHQESLKVAREIGYARGVMFALEFLGKTALELSRPEEAAGYFRESLGMAWESQAMPRVMQSLYGMALITRQSGAVERANRLLQIVASHPATEQATQQEAGAILAKEIDLAEASPPTDRNVLEELIRQLLAE